MLKCTVVDGILDEIDKKECSLAGHHERIKNDRSGEKTKSLLISKYIFYGSKYFLWKVLVQVFCSLNVTKVVLNFLSDLTTQQSLLFVDIRL